MAEKKQKAAKPAKRKMSFKNKFLLLIFFAAAIYFIKQGVIVMLIGLLPAFVATLVDTTPDRSWTKTVFCFNLAGLMPSLVEMVFAPNIGLATIQAVMGDPFMWLLAYGSAGLGWCVIWASPRLMEHFLVFYYRKCVDRHQAKLVKIDEEWNVSGSLNDKG